jgi:hypothetical protein
MAGNEGNSGKGMCCTSNLAGMKPFQVRKAISSRLARRTVRGLQEKRWVGGKV